jgi:NDP-sugar pyrophosphorylase family protein
MNVSKKLTPSFFFDLTIYQHAKIFQNLFFVWEALSKIESYLKEFSTGKIETSVPQGTFIIDPHLISIGKGTIIEPGSYIRGPCLIGENCTIRHGAYIRGNLITGNGCVIGHDTEIKSVIMLDNVHAAHFAYLGDSILGNHVNLGAGVKCANLRLNNEVVKVHLDKERINTGLRKLGAVLGDSVQLGCNSVTNPGTLMGKNSSCYPCTNFGGFIPEKHMVKPDFNLIVSPTQ